MNLIKSNNQIDSIQLLRGIAAIYVVSEHIPVKFFGDGCWGVDLFFIISSFIMCYVTEKTGENFFLKRLIRIIPLYWIGTMGIFLITLVAPHLLNTNTVNIVYLLKSFLFIPFQKGDAIVPLLFQGWTLQYEIFFYIIFAISMKINHKYRSEICSLLLVSIVISGLFFLKDSIIFQFFSNIILTEFIFGMFAFKLFIHANEYRKKRINPVSIPWTVFGIIILIFLPFASNFIPSEERVIKWGILSFISFFSIVHGTVTLKFSQKFLLIGNASYSLYLFHPYIIQLINQIFDLKSIESNMILTAIVILGIISICCIFSIFLFIYLEKPFDQYLKKTQYGNIQKPVLISYYFKNIL